ncbi:MAG: fumarylacetoacetate hydrolase family protein, partial [Nitrososphaerales archaeon]
MRSARFLAGGRVVSGHLEGKKLLGPDGGEYEPLDVTWLPPASPTKMIGLVLNYAEHAGELGLATAEDPVLMLKPNNTLLGNLGEIIYPREATHVHYEAELAVVISREARRIKQDKALEYIKGYTVANDVTARDFITNTFRPPVKAKGFDTFCPLGPYLVTPEEIPDVSNLNIKTVVNGKGRQEGNTKSMIHSIPELIEFITEFMTLEPEDIILTGTPKGISPIVPGDRLEISIDQLGTLTNT